MIRKLLLLLLLLGVAAAGLLWEVDRRWRTPLDVPPEGVTVTVAAGDSLRTVLKDLHERGVLPYPDLVRLYGRWTGLDQQIKRGEYLLPPESTALSLLQLLKSGKVIHYQVTLPEGITLARAVEILAQQEELEHELTGPDDPRILALVAPYEEAEGLFFPDSYHFSRGDSDWEVLQRAHRVMLDTLAAEWGEREPDLPYETPYEALVMASIIERETGLPEERREIAGVFVRRMKQGMRLQTDPTVIYGLGATFDGNLKRSHLKDSDNPYNTYRHHGLPPTPIALPGRAAIHAALPPLEGSSLYFVARGDGGPVFSETLAEHERAVRKYQLQRRADYRSSPGPE